jgi:hypothetical protein
MAPACLLLRDHFALAFTAAVARHIGGDREHTQLSLEIVNFPEHGHVT